MSMRILVRSLKNIFILFFTATILSGCFFQNSDGGERVGWGYNKGYSPDQPIAFNHELHVSTHKIQCQYCHNQVERSKTSNIPALSTCMNCHQQVATQSESIKKLREAYSENKFNLSLQDLIDMMNKTKSSFIEGKR